MYRILHVHCKISYLLLSVCTFLIEYIAWFTGTTTTITTTTTTTSIFQNCIWLFSCDYIALHYLDNEKINI